MQADGKGPFYARVSSQSQGKNSDQPFSKRQRVAPPPARLSELQECNDLVNAALVRQAAARERPVAGREGPAIEQAVSKYLPPVLATLVTDHLGSTIADVRDQLVARITLAKGRHDPLLSVVANGLGGQLVRMRFGDELVDGEDIPTLECVVESPISVGSGSTGLLHATFRWNSQQFVNLQFDEPLSMREIEGCRAAHPESFEFRAP